MWGALCLFARQCLQPRRPGRARTRLGPRPKRAPGALFVLRSASSNPKTSSLSRSICDRDEERAEPGSKALRYRPPCRVSVAVSGNIALAQEQRAKTLMDLPDIPGGLGLHAAMTAIARLASNVLRHQQTCFPCCGGRSHRCIRLRGRFCTHHCSRAAGKKVAGVGQSGIQTCCAKTQALLAVERSVFQRLQLQAAAGIRGEPLDTT